ncbi:hypothetical protein TWF718_007104 [Orbilia javanica]|uniref:Uncharacterized protein n=1 Tax=Orbilia javanica TaxID=47235 RepID=A0AAN8RNC6_9PEZI
MSVGEEGREGEKEDETKPKGRSDCTVSPEVGGDDDDDGDGGDDGWMQTWLRCGGVVPSGGGMR